MYYRLKTPYRDGTTHLVLEPLDFLARLAASMPPPRVHRTRTHGVFAPHAALRAVVTPSGRGSGARRRVSTPEPATAKHVAMSWAARRKRVFAIAIEQCTGCGGRLRVLASIEQPAWIERMLAHRRQHGQDHPPGSARGAGILTSFPPVCRPAPRGAHSRC